MKIKKFINITLAILILCLTAGVGAFIYNAENKYEINSNFVSLPLQFNPEDSSSTYKLQNTQVTVYGGFVKGMQKGKDGNENLILRALSPLPAITLKSDTNAKITLLIENINPDFYAKSIESIKLPLAKVSVNTLQLNINIDADDTFEIEPVQPENNSEDAQYVILGDNRDGYDTFEKIIQQVNGLKPVFVIDNGDLVFSGKPNQYRLFDNMVSKLSSTLLTTTGNHDIRGNGKSIYTMLYGPAYYSFDYADSHFVFLDSAPGWSEKKAISDEQYTWLEKDLMKAQGKRIFVVTHIPPHDPRAGVKANEISDYVDQIKSGENWLEQKLNNYNENKDMEHGFQDPVESEKFEKLMSAYKVDTVYLSHIHSYFDYKKDGVRYLITGGAGAELLTKNSYYHYIISKFKDSNSLTMVELPSPANNYITRYTATVQLFATAMYEENPAAVILVITGLVLLVILLIVRIYLREKEPIDKLWTWLKDTVKYAVNRFKELYGDKKNR